MKLKAQFLSDTVMMKTFFVQLLILIGSAGAHEIKRGVHFIIPGTKWCGEGNIANHINDLGSEAATDICCRAHDFCNDIIIAGGRRYNLINWASYTRLNCHCDHDFYKCLKDANTPTSNLIGIAYFNLLGTQCFRKYYPIVRCIKRGMLPLRQCQQYQYSITKDKIYQWFDEKDY
ncbi:hypothetical protein FQR65_LT11381 [Abscondita terminalis]|nr:hypothetical protein FQR65_LT11381 [Abscondita terminalis]